MLTFYSYHKDFYEKLCRLWALVKDDKKISKNIGRIFKKGTYTVLVFDNYSYYTGAIVEVTDKKKINITCPMETLNLHGPVHWRKRAEDFLKHTKILSSVSKNNDKAGIIILDLRHLRRIVSSKDILLSFIRLAYTGAIYVDLPSSSWLFLRGYALLKSIKIKS